MDNALRQRMVTFPTKAQVEGLINPTHSEPSTLIKADIALFHESPDVSAISHRSAAPPYSDYDLGVQDGEAKASLIYEDTIRLMEAALASLKGEVSALLQQIEKDHFAAVSTCLQAISPGLTKASAHMEILTIVRNLSSATLEGDIEMTSHSDNMSDLERLCASQTQAIKLVENNSLALGTVEVKWLGGGAIIDTEAVQKACSDVLKKAESSLNQISLSSILQEKE